MTSKKNRNIFAMTCFTVTGVQLLGALVISALLVSGCAMVGPDYVKPSAPEPKEWLQEEEPKLKSEEADFSQWWTIFDDTILNDLIQAAYLQNLPLRIAGVRIMEARARLGIAVGNRYPQLQQVGAGYTRANLSENAANTAGADHAYGEYDVGFDAAWELDFWGKFRRGVESSAASLEASVADYDDALVSLTAEVARTYVVIRTLEERLAIARENVKIQERSLKIAQVRFEGGVVTELDVQQAKALLRDTQALIPRLESDLRQAKNGLAILLGALPGDVDGMLAASKPIPTPPVEVAVGIPAELLRRRPDIRFAEFQVAAQSARIGIAKADLYPHFSLLGSVGLRTGDSASALTRGNDIGDLFKAKSIEYFAGPTLRWDILNYGRIKNRVRVEDARLQELVVNYQNTVLRSARETEDAMVAFVRSEEESVFLSESVVASKRSVDLALIQYREGLVDYQRVLDTQRSLTQQQDFLTATKGSVTLNLIAVYKALGGGWQIRAGKDFVPEQTKEAMRGRTNWGDLLSQEEVDKVSSEKANRWWWPDW
jgi:NodT family efflux transporter outer membrane factor (OMF) lipoprotein